MKCERVNEFRAEKQEGCVRGKCVCVKRIKMDKRITQEKENVY